MNKQKPEFKTVWQNLDDFKEHKLEIYFGVDKLDSRYYVNFVIDGENKFTVEQVGKGKYRMLNDDENNLSKLLGEISQHWEKLCELYKFVK